MILGLFFIGSGHGDGFSKVGGDGGESRALTAIACRFLPLRSRACPGQDDVVMGAVNQTVWGLKAAHLFLD